MLAKTKLTIPILFLMVVCAIGAIAQSVTPAILQISITDQNNNPVPNYEVLIRPNGGNLPGEVVVETNINGYWSDTIGLYEDATDPGDWFFGIYVLDSAAWGVVRYATFHSGPIQSPYWVSDTFKFQLTNPIKAADNCGSYQVSVDPSANNPMFIYFRNDLNRLKTGTTWVYGDGDTGHAPQSSHRYSVPGKYYYCHYTDSCGPVCDSVTVAMNGTGVGLIEQGPLSDFELFPNPVVDVLTISSSNQSDAIKEVCVFDLSGNQLYRVQYGNGQQKVKAQLDLICLRSGIYVITIKSGKDLIKTSKFFKQ